MAVKQKTSKEVDSVKFKHVKDWIENQVDWMSISPMENSAGQKYLRGGLGSTQFLRSAEVNASVKTGDIISELGVSPAEFYAAIYDLAKRGKLAIVDDERRQVNYSLDRLTQTPEKFGVSPINAVRTRTGKIGSRGQARILTASITKPPKPKDKPTK